MFDLFAIPKGIERDLTEFFKRQLAFPLSCIRAKPPKDDPYLELAQHYGVYILYYRGDFPLYADIAERNASDLVKPIYVGKAVSSGARTGRGASAAASGMEDEEVSPSAAEKMLDPKAPVQQANSLYKRLNEHRASIDKGEGLSVEDFDARVIPMADALVQWAEAVMIRRLQPIWNARLSGFGNHDPGKGRYEQARSIWDQLHPGRPWALKMRNLAPYNEDDLRRQIRQTLDVDLN